MAEYTAVVRALRLATELGAREVRLLLDSMLIVEQLNGRWKVRDAKLAVLNDEARAPARGVPALVGGPRPAGVQLRGGRARERGDRPVPGRWADVGGAPAALTPAAPRGRGGQNPQ